MEKYADLIGILLQHSQRFLDFWNLQLVVALAVLGFVFSNEAIASKRFNRIVLSFVFIFMASYSLFSLAAHQRREEKLYTAIEARVMAEAAKYTPEEIEYLQALDPTSFNIKAGALLLADLLVILVIWFAPHVNAKHKAESIPPKTLIH